MWKCNDETVRGDLNRTECDMTGPAVLQTDRSERLIRLMARAHRTNEAGDERGRSFYRKAARRFVLSKEAGRGCDGTGLVS